ncbi:hypothetical protein BsWGS_16414 [Bradybaena similaris]
MSLDLCPPPSLDMSTCHWTCALPLVWICLHVIGPVPSPQSGYVYMSLDLCPPPVWICLHVIGPVPSPQSGYVYMSLGLCPPPPSLGMSTCHWASAPPPPPSLAMSTCNLVGGKCTHDVNISFCSYFNVQCISAS